MPLADQSAESIVSAVLGNYILYYGTPRRILTDQGTSFESEIFQNFCKLFRINKIRTSGYRPQSNGMCERFNQTLKSFLRKILSDSNRANWDLYLNFAVFAYNIAEHSSTSFSPYFLTFGEEARLPADLLFGFPSVSASTSTSSAAILNSSGPDLYGLRGFGSIFRSFSLLSQAFLHARRNLNAFHQREKDRYDLGMVERVFKPGDQVRIRLKSRFKGPAKFAPSYSGAHEVVSVQGVILTVRELSSGRVYHVHHDRASNPLLVPTEKEREPEPAEVPTDANPVENEREAGEDLQPVGNPEDSLIRTRYGRVIKPNRNRDFDYQSFYLEVPTNLAVFVRDQVNRPHALTAYMLNRPCRHANTEHLANLQVGQARSDAKHQLEVAGEVVCMLFDRGENAVMARSNGVIYIYSDERRDFVSLFDRSTYTQLLTESAGPRHPNWRELSAVERTLPPLISLLPGYTAKRHTRFGYGFSEEWRAFVEAQTPKPVCSGTVAAGASTSTTAVSQSGPVIASQSGPLNASLSGPLSSMLSGPLNTARPDLSVQCSPDLKRLSRFPAITMQSGSEQMDVTPDKQQQAQQQRPQHLVRSSCCGPAATQRTSSVA